MTDPRIEEMTADQPAIRADERTRIAAELDAYAQRMAAVQPEHEPNRIWVDGLACAAGEVRSGNSATVPSVPGLSVCVAQLAAIRQLVDEIHGHGADTLEGEMWRLRGILNRIDAVLGDETGGVQ